jgi:hypothetical protein
MMAEQQSPVVSKPAPVAPVLPTRFKSQEFVFTPYQVPRHISLAVSSWMATGADHRGSDPLWTSLVEQPTIPPPSYQPTFIPYIPGASFPSHGLFSASDNRSSTSHSSKAPSLDSTDTKVNEVLAQDITSSGLAEKGQANAGLGWEGYLDDELPPQTHGNSLSRIRHAIFSLYRRLFGVVLVTNLGIFVATLIKGHTNALQLGQVVIANFFVAILMRQDHVVNAFFNVLCSGEQVSMITAFSCGTHRFFGSVPIRLVLRIRICDIFLT